MPNNSSSASGGALRKQKSASAKVGLDEKKVGAVKSTKKSTSSKAKKVPEEVLFGVKAKDVASAGPVVGPLGDAIKGDAAKGDAVLAVIEGMMDDSKLLEITSYECHPDYFADFVCIGTGTSARHVEGAAEKIVKELKQKCKLVPIVDKKTKEWIVIDAGSVIAHVMLSRLRANYDLDDLMAEYGNKPKPLSSGLKG